MRLWEPKRNVQRPSQHTPKSCRVVMVPQVQCEVICDRALNQMLFQWIYNHAGPHIWQNIVNQQLWAFGVPWSPGFVLDLPPRDGFWIQSKSPWNFIHSMPCRNLRRHYIYLAFTYILRWSLKRSVIHIWSMWTIGMGQSMVKWTRNVIQFFTNSIDVIQHVIMRPWSRTMGLNNVRQNVMTKIGQMCHCRMCNSVSYPIRGKW